MKKFSLSNGLFSICIEAVSNSPMRYNFVHLTKNQCTTPCSVYSINIIIGIGKGLLDKFNGFSGFYPFLAFSRKMAVSLDTAPKNSEN
jgi:hypothetical protein